MTRPEDFSSAPLSDSVFHGLVSLNHEVTDWPNLWYMYKDGRIEKRSPFKSVKELYGLGFGYSRTIDDNLHIDRNLTNLENKISNEYFDIIILSTLCYQPSIKSDLEDLIFKYYPKSKIIILCDKTEPELIGNWNVQWLISKGTFFKRELAEKYTDVYPISIGFPKEKILATQKIKKEKLIADVNVVRHGPSKKTFLNENDYYLEYAKSYFGMSWKKDGWNVTRPYEIIASGALPYITDIKECPKMTNTDLPKIDLIKIVDLIETHGIEWFLTDTGKIMYWELQQKIFSHFMQHCTTEALAKYVLKTHKNAT